jgi:hypothetical protein
MSDRPTSSEPLSAKRITDYLTQDHGRLQALLERAMSSVPFDDAAFAEFRRGLLRHIKIEEKLLFPAARWAKDGAPLERARELREEHAAIGSLLVPPPDAALCREIASILGPHDEKEEGPQGVYAECESRLSAAESADLAARAASYPEVRVAQHLDWPEVYRTAESALAAARRTREPSA